MKKIILTCFTIIALFSLIACDNDSSPIFVAQPPIEGIAFTSSFASEYLLSEETNSNIADRFIWESANFDVPTSVTYELHGSIDSNFDDFSIVGSTSELNIAVTVGQLLVFAYELGLDDDPLTTHPDGTPNNNGLAFFRIRANVGASDVIETFSEIQPINITMIEKLDNGGACASLYAVGAGLADIGWNFTPEGEILCENDVLSTKFRFTNDKFRLFEESGVWDVSYGFNYYTDAGYTIDPLLVASIDHDPNDGDDNFWFEGDEGIYTLTIDNNDKTIVLVQSSSLWAVGGAVPGGWNFDVDNTVEFVENTPDIWSASIALTNDVFRFFQTFGVWDTNNNYTYYEDQGFTIDANLENDGSDDANFNFVGTPGTYTLTIDAIEKKITLD